MTIRRHSVSIHGHRTSVSIEDAFWAELKRLARDEGRSVAAVIATVDRARAGQGGDAPNLSSALRLHVLERLQVRANRDPQPVQGTQAATAASFPGSEGQRSHG